MSKQLVDALSMSYLSVVRTLYFFTGITCTCLLSLEEVFEGNTLITGKQENSPEVEQCALKGFGRMRI